MNPQTAMDEAPDDILVHIFRQLNVLESLPIRLVSRKWRALYEQTRNKIVCIANEGTLSKYTLQTGERFCLEFRAVGFAHPLNKQGYLTFLPSYHGFASPNAFTIEALYFLARMTPHSNWRASNYPFDIAINLRKLMNAPEDASTIKVYYETQQTPAEQFEFARRCGDRCTDVELQVSSVRQVMSPQGNTHGQLDDELDGQLATLLTQAINGGSLALRALTIEYYEDDCTFLETFVEELLTKPGSTLEVLRVDENWWDDTGWGANLTEQALENALVSLTELTLGNTVRPWPLRALERRTRPIEFMYLRKIGLEMGLLDVDWPKVPRNADITAEIVLDRGFANETAAEQARVLQAIRSLRSAGLTVFELTLHGFRPTEETLEALDDRGYETIIVKDGWVPSMAVSSAQELEAVVMDMWWFDEDECRVEVGSPSEAEE